MHAVFHYAYADPLGPISTKIGKVVGVHDVINHSKFGFNVFRGFRSTGGQNFRFPIDFAGHRYNSAAATAQPVIEAICLRDSRSFHRRSIVDTSQVDSSSVVMLEWMYWVRYKLKG